MVTAWFADRPSRAVERKRVCSARALPVGLYGTEYRMKLNDVNVATQPPKPGLPAQAIAEEVLLEKYAKGGELTIDDVRRRVARALAAVELPEKRAVWEESFYRAQVGGLILGGRINSAAGTELKATLINCFVQPVGDSISNDDGEG